MKKLILFVSVLVVALLAFSACANRVAPSKPNSDVKVVAPQKEEANFIGEEKAKEIALEKAGLAKEDVVFDRVELDFDNGIWEYEVEFRHGFTEYDADIKAEDGTILKWEKDIDD